MARINFNDIAGNEYAVTYNWNIRLVSLPTAVQPIANALGLIFTGESGVTNLFCTSVAVPTAAVTIAEVNIRGHKLKQPTNPEFDGEITLNFAERVDWKITKFFEDWKRLSFDHFTGVGTPKAAMMMRQGFLLDLLDQDQAIQATYELNYAYPSNVVIPEVTGEAGDIVRFDLTVNYHVYDRR